MLSKKILLDANLGEIVYCVLSINSLITLDRDEEPGDVDRALYLAKLLKEKLEERRELLANMVRIIS